MIKFLDWDSSFFGIKTGRIDFRDTEAIEISKQFKLLENSGFQLIYIFAPHHSKSIKKAILTSKALLVDEKVTYSMDISGIKAPSSGSVVSVKGSAMDEQLRMLAIESGKYSRFRADDKIPRKKFEELYRLWMENSLNGKFAKDVFVYEEGGRRSGMITIDIRQGEGWIGIIAVDEASRGKSIGRLLIYSVIRFCRDRGIKILNVQTQAANKVSCAFYEKLGFSVKDIEDVYHFWNEKE